MKILLKLELLNNKLFKRKMIQIIKKTQYIKENNRDTLIAVYKILFI